MRNPLPRLPYRRLVPAAIGALALSGIVAAAAAVSVDSPDREPVSFEPVGDDHRLADALRSRGSASSAPATADDTTPGTGSVPTGGTTDDSTPVTTDDSTPGTVDDSTPGTVDDDATSTSEPDDDDTTSTSEPDDDDTTSTSEPDDDEPALAPFTKTYTLVGGTVVVTSSDGRTMQITSVTANPGFEAEIEHGAGDRVEVRFESDDHESRLRVEIDDGALDEEIEERVDD